MAHNDLDTSSAPRPPGRWAIAISILWAVCYLLAWRYLTAHLGIIREFEPESDFAAHNRIHWFRPIAFFWFARSSLVPSLVFATLICARHKLRFSSKVATSTLAALSAFLLVLGAYTIWEHTATMHHFVP